MKVTYLITMIIFYCTCTQAQDLRLNTYTGYIFQENFRGGERDDGFIKGRIDGSFQWELGFEYTTGTNTGIELSFARQVTEVPIEFEPASMERSRVLDMDANYILGGANRYLPVSDKVEVYIGLKVGAVIFDINDPDRTTARREVNFSINAQLGGNYWFNERIGIKMSVKMFSPIQGFSDEFYFGSSSSGGLSTFSSIYQISLVGGIAIKLFQNNS